MTFIVKNDFGAIVSLDGEGRVLSVPFGVQISMSILGAVVTLEPTLDALQCQISIADSGLNNKRFFAYRNPDSQCGAIPFTSLQDVVGRIKAELNGNL